MNKLPVIVSFNRRYLIPALVTILSTVKNSSSPDELEFFVMHHDLDIYSIRLCESVVYSWGYVVNFINCKDLINDVYNICETRYSSETFNTLLVPYLFFKYGKVVYLDVDLLVRDDILKLVHEIPETKKLGAVRCFFRNYIRYGDDFHGMRGYARMVLKMKNPYDYFNSGVLVFNNKNISSEESRQCISLLEKKWEHHDEGILNHIFQDDVHLFSSRWNMYASHIGENIQYFAPVVRNDLLEAQGNYSIVHFLGKSKPWLEPSLDVENIYMREYGEFWYKVKEDIERLAPSILCGSMWKMMNRVNWKV